MRETIRSLPLNYVVRGRHEGEVLGQASFQLLFFGSCAMSDKGSNEMAPAALDTVTTPGGQRGSPLSLTQRLGRYCGQDTMTDG